MTNPVLPPDQWSNEDAFFQLLPLESERLRYRRTTLEDVDHIHRHRSDPEVCRHIAPPMDRDKVAALVESRLRWTGQDGHMICLIPELKDGTPIGELGVRIESVADRLIEIGYILQPPYFGKGYATEIAHTLNDFCFQQLGAHKTVGRCDAENAASINVLNKVGMKREALFRHQVLRDTGWADLCIYACLSPYD